MHFNSLKIICIVALDLQLLQPVHTTGVVSLRLVDFLHLGLQVDQNTTVVISVCMTNTLSRGCSYGDSGISVFIQGDYIKFGSTVGNTSNPITFKFNSWEYPSRLIIKVCNTSCDVNQNNTVLIQYSEDLETYPEHNGVHREKHIVFMEKYSRFEVELDTHCDPGYYGDCTRYCTDHPYRYKCDCTGHKICEAGWEGIECDKNIDDCIGVHCQNNATCRDGFNTFYCICSRGFTGIYCEEKESTGIKQNTKFITKAPKIYNTSTSEQKTTDMRTSLKTSDQTATTSEKTPDQTATTSEKTPDQTATTSEKTSQQTATTSEKTSGNTATTSEKTPDKTMEQVTSQTTNINTKYTAATLEKNTAPSNNSQDVNLKSLRRLGNKQNEDNGLPISSGGVIGISVSIVGLVLVSVIVIKLVRWCRMKDTFTVNDGSSTSSDSEDFAAFDNQAAQSEWMYYRNL